MCHWLAHGDVGNRRHGCHVQHFLSIIWNEILENQTYIKDASLVISLFFCILLVRFCDEQYMMNIAPSKT